MTKAEKARQDEAREYLRSMIQPGGTVYTVLRHVSRSGMYRALDCYVMTDGEPLRVSYWVAKAIGFKYDRKHEAIGVGGCGTDVGFEVVYNLGRALFGAGFDCIGTGCPSNDHSNGADNAHHRDGGYALRHRWM